jgi:hypothetical protein
MIPSDGATSVTGTTNEANSCHHRASRRLPEKLFFWFYPAANRAKIHRYAKTRQ